MLRDNINNRVRMTDRIMPKEIKKQDNGEYFPLEFRGELDVKGWRDGELVYHDGGDNTITVWAKHLTMHLLTGDVYSNKGISGQNQPGLLTTDHDGATSPYHNTDGMLVSSKQYWWNVSDFPQQWSNIPTSPSGYEFPFFPTKMLFGTGKEYASWEDVPTAEQALLASDWTPTVFNNGISNTENFYSATTQGTGGVVAKSGNTPLVKTRTVNDVYSGKFTGAPDSNEYGVEGAIKNGTARYANDIVFPDGKTDLFQQYKGIGKPCFIYCKRETRWSTSSSEVFMSRNIENNYEHKLTFSITMPDQTNESGANGWYYPYNGYTLKVVGLFADARLCFNDEVPTVSTSSDYYPYFNMPCGIMMAKRYIAPITKTSDLKLTAQWTIYL